MDRPSLSSPLPALSWRGLALGLAAGAAPTIARAADGGTLADGAGWITGGLIVGAAAAGAWWMGRRAGRAVSESARQLASLVEFADCLIWQGTVTLRGADWQWKFQVQPTGLSRRIFRDRRPEDAGLWREFNPVEKDEMDRRCREALENGRPGYVQEFHFLREGKAIWLRESVTITRLGPNRFSLVGLVTEITVQREAELVQRASEDRLKQLLSRADCMLWQARVTGDPQRDTAWEWFIPDSELFRSVGGKAGGSSPMPWNRTLVPEYTEMADRAAKALREGSAGYEQEFRVVVGNQMRWLREQVTVERQGPTEWRLEGVIVDITAQREAEATMRANEEQLQQVMRAADFMLWHARVFRSAAGEFHWVMNVPASTLYRRVFGGEPGRPGVMPWETVVSRETFDRMVAHAHGAFTRGEAGYDQEVEARRAGEAFRLREHATIRAIGPDEWQAVGIVTDVTKQRQAEEARQGSERALREILERANCLLWRATVMRRGDDVEWVQFELPSSRLFVELQGGRPAGESDRLWEFSDVPELKEMNARSTRAMLAGASGYEQEFQATTAGRRFWLHEQVTITPIGQEGWRLVGVITDLSGRREAEEARRQTEAQLQRILELADCMVWEATVTEYAGGELLWDLYTPRSMLYRRLFGDDAGGRPSLEWRRLNVPEMAEIEQRAREALQQRAPGYEQEFRVVQQREVIWLREVVTINAIDATRFRLVGVITDITAQREGQEAYLASLAQAEQMLEGADCLLWQARVFEVSPGELRWVLFIPRSRLYRDIFGHDPGSPPGIIWSEVLDPMTEREVHARSSSAIFANAPGYEQEFRAQRTGRAFWLYERVTITPVGPGEWRVVGVLTDVTARRAAEESVRASELRYRTLYQHAPVAIVEADFSAVASWLDQLRAEGVTNLPAWLEADQARVLQAARLVRIIDCNDTAMMMLRARSKADFRRRRGMLASVDSMRMVIDVTQAIWEGRNRLEAEIDMHDFVGALHRVNLRWWMERSGEKLDHQQSVLTLVDLTDLKRAEAALAAEKERLAVTLRAMAEGVVTTDVEGRVQFMNEAAAAFTGCEAATAIGQPVGAICNFENDRTGERVEVPVARVAQGDVVIELPGRTRMTAQDGGSRLVEGCCAPIHSATSSVIGMVLVFRDVTEHERLEQELVRATKLESVGILAGGIAHDFNNILTAVMGNVALAALDVEPASDAGRSLAEAEKATLRARDLTQQLLTFAKGGEPVRAAVRLDAVVREIATFTLHGSKVKAHFDLPAGLWAADADKGQIGRVVQNLVLNAVQAMPEGGAIRIALSNDHVDGLTNVALAPGDYVKIEIRDSGIGIKPEHLPRIFDPYFTTKQMGSGLGLAAVYSIVNKHRGMIDVQSQLGEGTTFRIWLPASPDAEALAADPSLRRTTVSFKGRVLFMDDEEAIRQMATFLLRRFGFEVVCASDGAEAVARFREAHEVDDPFTLVIMDLTVPGGMGGREAVQKVLEIDPAARVIVSSGYSSDPVLANYRQHGFCGVVAKPYEVSDFARVLREALAEEG